LDEDIANSLGLEEARGALVASVTPDGPAARAGLQQGDVILTFNGQQIENSRDLTQRVGATAIGNNSRVEILRNGRRQTLNLRLAERPSEQQLAATNTPPNATPQPQPEERGGVAQSSLGLSVRPLTPEDRTRLSLRANEGGLVITSVEPTSDAAQKGIRAGNVIMQAGGSPISTVAQLNEAVNRARSANRQLLLQVTNGAGRGFVAVDVGGQ
jgi:serine protease Do